MARFRLPRRRRERRPDGSPPPILRWFLREREPRPPVSEPPPAPALEPPPEPAPSQEAPGEAPDEARVGRLRRSLGDAAAAAGRLPVALGRGARQTWFSLSVATRRHLALAVGVAAVLLVILFVAVPALPCEAPGGDPCPPPDDAIHLVPDDALAYAHANVDPDTRQYEDASELAGQVPALAEQLTDRLLARVPGPRGAPLDFASDVEPWFGGQVALALIPSGGRIAEEVQLLQVDDTDAARSFAESVATGSPQTEEYRGVDVRMDRRGLATAFVGGFLAIGRSSGVRDTIDAQSGAPGTGSLADDESAREARAALPEERLADAYLSVDGIARLVDNPRGPLATLDAAVDPTASEGVAMAVVAGEGEFDLDIHSMLNEARAEAQPGFFAAFPAFEPTLTASLPADSLAYLGLADPGRTLASLIEQASADEPGLAAAVAELTKRVKELGRVNLEAELLPSLGREAAFAVAPSAAAGESAAQTQGVPYLEFLANGIDAERAGRALASLQAPIAEALSPRGGQAPTFSEEKIDGVTAHSVRLSATVDLTYAIADSVLVIASDPEAVRQLAEGDGSLAADSTFAEATDGLPDSVSALAYFNLGGLITLGEQAGLAEDPAYGTFAGELRKLRALALAVRQSPTELETDVRLLIGSAPEPSGAVQDRVAPSD